MPHKPQTAMFSVEVKGRDKTAAAAYKIIRQFTREHQQEVADAVSKAMTDMFLNGSSTIQINHKT